MNSHLLNTDLDKLEYLKLYMSSVRGLSDEDHEYIQQATSVGEVSCFLFSRGLFSIYNQIANYIGDISPDINEMRKICDEYDANAWYWLLSSVNGIPVLEDLLAKNTIPEPKDLTVINSETGFDSWYLLAKNPYLIHVLYKLFKLNVCPDNHSLNYTYGNIKKNIIELLKLNQSQLDPVMFTTVIDFITERRRIFRLEILKNIIFPGSNKKHQEGINSASEIWRMIFLNQLFDILKKIYAHGLYPEQDELNQTHLPDNKTVWHVIAESESSCDEFLQLIIMDKVLPDQQILSETDKNNENLYYIFSKSENGIRVLHALVNKHRVPDHQDLARISSTSKVNMYHQLARAENGRLYLTILKNKFNIIPDCHDLAILDPVSGENGWILLASSLTGCHYISYLVLQNIRPEPSDYSVISRMTQKNLWETLVENKTGLSILIQLLSRGMIIRKHDIANIWPCLLKEDPGKTVFHLLIKNGFYPISSDLLKMHQDGTDSWDKLTDHLDLFLAVINHHVYPPASRIDNLVAKILTKHGNINQYNQIKNIFTGLNESMNSFNSKYNFKNQSMIGPENLVGYMLISAKDRENLYCNFLFFYYVFCDTHRPFLPYDIILRIANILFSDMDGKNIFPDEKAFAILDSNDNRKIFHRYDTIKFFNNYIKNYNKTLIKGSLKNIERVVSLKDAVLHNQDFENVLLEQYLMANNPGTFYSTELPLKAHQRPYPAKITDDFLLADHEFNRIINNSFSIFFHHQRIEKVKSPGNKKISHFMIQHIYPQYETLMEKYNKNKICFILYSLMDIFHKSSDDTDSLCKAMNYILSIPVIHPVSKNTVLFIDFLNDKNDASIDISNNNHPVIDGDLTDIYDLFNDIIKQFSAVLQWDCDYSFVKNNNNEISTPGIKQWQTLFLDPGNDCQPNAAFVDFNRKVTLNGQKGNACCLVLSESIPEVEILQEIERHAGVCCLIRTKYPNALYLIEGTYNKVKQIHLSDILLESFDSNFKPDQQLKYLSDHELGNLATISASLCTPIIQINLERLCKQIKTSQDNQQLFMEWLKKFGGQRLNQLVDVTFAEGHFFGKIDGDHFDKMSMFTTSHFSQNWAAKNNSLVCELSLNIDSINLNDKYYCKRNGSKFLMHSDQQYIADHAKEVEPILSINAEISLVIDDCNSYMPTVKPVLDKYTVSCHASMTATGKLILQSPERNQILVDLLRDNNKQENKSGFKR